MEEFEQIYEIGTKATVPYDPMDLENLRNFWGMKESREKKAFFQRHIDLIKAFEVSQNFEVKRFSIEKCHMEETVFHDYVRKFFENNIFSEFSNIIGNDRLISTNVSLSCCDDDQYKEIVFGRCNSTPSIVVYDCNVEEYLHASLIYPTN